MTTHIHSAMLVSDWIVYGLLVLAIGFAIWIYRQPHYREPWRQVFQKRLGMIALVFLIFYAAIGLLDSIHLRIEKQNTNGQVVSSQVYSVFDLLIAPIGQEEEKTYSAPFATTLFTQTLVTLPNGKDIRTYPRLRYGGAHLQNPATEKSRDILLRSLMGISIGIIAFMLVSFLFVIILAMRHRIRLSQSFKQLLHGKTVIAWREALITAGVIFIAIGWLGSLATHYHIFGTDKIGRDVFYEALKSIRTGLLIGTLTTIFMLPFALSLGTIAGYFRGVADDIIQYIYTTLSSIPGVLLISATILVLQVYISRHSDLFPSLMQRADARLLALCFILGITSWASLCRLLRAETLKLRGQEFIQAAHSLAVRDGKIIWRHIMPNVMHIVLITLVLDFSSLVLAEAVLSYVGVGVDPTTFSWGNMINSSRLELAREPIVWWPLLAALVFMFLLVLAANLFADSVRDAFDPRLREISETSNYE